MNKERLSVKRVVILSVVMAIVYTVAFFQGRSGTTTECAELVISMPRAERVIEVPSIRDEFPDPLIVKELGTAVFMYRYEHAGTLETRVRLGKREGQFMVFDLEDARDVGMEALFADLETLPGIETIHVHPWKIHLEKTAAFSWAEVEPLLQEIGEKHNIL